MNVDRRLFLRCAMMIEVVVGCVVVLGANGYAQQPPAPLQGCTGVYVIGPEDVLDIAVWGNAEITRTVPVRPDGKISLPLLNDVQAAGLTPLQLREAVAKALTVYIPQPAVSVLVREIHSIKVTVIGQVKTPGRYELKDRATVLDLLAMAGGLTEFAARGRILVLREEHGETRQIPFPYDRLTSKSGGSDGNGSNGSKDGGPENICVRGGDIIVVP
jgi:polysaccharide biosynthesis/export protein